MGHLFNESIRAETDSSGRLTAYEWRGARYTVHEILKAYGGADDARIYRVRVRGEDTSVAVAELAHAANHWRLRHLFSA
ncbi:MULTISPECIES: hypothetical protein [Thermomonospora]|uniref:Uncharacterized protein n=1 Tax=Thermomonospora cellulosilytica TaxID=1411118 RepID=A0A7W3R6H7_9ACTN|nr:MULTISPECIES: hypothetical protein [Thermomonospora]MBA9002173.1 hypothetical protein [Thermomonospora cellulosilytica]